jgi:tetratricopeptide (TPR) repeat protein
MMTKTELDQLQASIGELMSVHSFFSTTPDYGMASAFTQARDGFVSVLFEIEIDTNLKDTKPFADITQLSYMPGEKEILFGMSAIFRVVSIDDYPDMYWVKLKLCSDSDIVLKPLLDRLTSRISEKTSACHFAIVLYEMGLLDKAKETFEQLLKICPTNHPDIIEIHRFLGQIADERGHADQAIDYYRQTIHLEKELLSSDDPRRAITLLNLSVVHRSKGEIKNAIVCIEEALSIWQNAPGEHHQNIARCLNNMGTLFIRDQPDKALDYFEQALTIRRRYLPANDAEIAENLGNIGGVHGILGHYDLALKYANESLVMLADRLPSMSLNMADAYRNVGVAHAGLRQYNDALYFYQKAAVILRQIVEPNHPRRVQIEKDLVRTVLKRAEVSFNSRFDQMLACVLDKYTAKKSGTPSDDTE